MSGHHDLRRRSSSATRPKRKDLPAEPDRHRHVDFNYEVSRSLNACEGAILVVDASQGVEAQTPANVYLAIENDLEIVPVLNKIDLPSAEPDRIAEEIEEVIGIDATDAVRASAKTGVGVPDILDAIVELVPPPEGDVKALLQVMLFDSWFDAFRGVTVMARVVSGTLRKGDKALMMAIGAVAEIRDRGLLALREAGERAARRRRGLHRDRHQGRTSDAHRRHDDPRRAAGPRAAPGLPGDQAERLLRRLPDRLEGLR